MATTNQLTYADWLIAHPDYTLANLFAYADHWQYTDKDGITHSNLDTDQGSTIYIYAHLNSDANATDDCAGQEDNAADTA